MSSSLALLEEVIKKGHFLPLDDAPWDKEIQVTPEDLKFMHATVDSNDEVMRERISEIRKQ